MAKRFGKLSPATDTSTSGDLFDNLPKHPKQRRDAKRDPDESERAPTLYALALRRRFFWRRPKVRSVSFHGSSLHRDHIPAPTGRHSIDRRGGA